MIGRCREFPSFLPSLSMGGTCVYFGKVGSGREARPVERVDSARCALDARDSRHWTGRAAVHAAPRSLITSPGRPPYLRPAHGNVTLWYNVHVSATSVSGARPFLARYHISEHPSLPNSAQRTRQQRAAGALYQIPARLCRPARRRRPGSRLGDVIRDLGAVSTTTRFGQCRESRARRTHEFARSTRRASRSKPGSPDCQP